MKVNLANFCLGYSNKVELSFEFYLIKSYIFLLTAYEISFVNDLTHSCRLQVSYLTPSQFSANTVLLVTNVYYLWVSFGVGALNPAECVKGARVDGVHVMDAVDGVAHVLKKSPSALNP